MPIQVALASNAFKPWRRTFGPRDGSRSFMTTSQRFPSVSTKLSLNAESTRNATHRFTFMGVLMSYSNLLETHGQGIGCDIAQLAKFRDQGTPLNGIHLVRQRKDVHNDRLLA